MVTLNDEATVESELRIVTFSTLSNEVLSSQRDVVLVYLWSEYSIPERITLAKIATAFQGYQKLGLEVVTVCTSATESDGEEGVQILRRRTIERLEKANAHFRNYLLDPTAFPREYYHLLDGWLPNNPPIFLLFVRASDDGKQLKLTGQYGTIEETQVGIRAIFHKQDTPPK